MSEAFFTPLALQDLDEIWCYIAEDNPSAADAIQADLREAANGIAAMPSIGHRRRDLTAGDVWFVAVRKTYLVVYRKARPVEIIRVLHGARDVKPLLDE